MDVIHAMAVIIIDKGEPGNAVKRILRDNSETRSSSCGFSVLSDSFADVLARAYMLIDKTRTRTEYGEYIIRIS